MTGASRPQSAAPTSRPACTPERAGECATLACLLEASAPKCGNVHRGADFEDMTYLDFVLSAAAIRPALTAAAAGAPLGQCVLDAVAATRRLVGKNTNLGTVLLLVPLAQAAGRGGEWKAATESVFACLSREDAVAVYEAIRLAQPGGLGQADQHDLEAPAPLDLLEAMRLAASRDLIAREYASGCELTFQQTVPALRRALEQGWPLECGIVHVHLQLIAAHGDSLIERKLGPQVAQSAQQRARRVLAAGPPTEAEFWRAVGDFDFWLRSDHHRRNPGTTADLIAAGLFVALVEGWLSPPFHFYPASSIE